MMKIRKIIASLLIVATMIPAICIVSAFADTNDDSYAFVVTTNAFTMITPREKGDASPIWVRVDTMTHSSKCKAKAQGNTTSNQFSENWTNYTCSKGVLTDYVVLNEDVNQKIHSLIYESGKSYARLGFMGTSGYTYEHLDGWWSADSSHPENYISAYKEF